MTFTPKIWAEVIAACYPPDMRETTAALWRAQPGYFFEMHPAPSKALQLDSGPVMLFERSPEIFHTILETFEELVNSHPSMDWSRMNDIWLVTKPWWDEFEKANEQDEMLCILRDPDDYANGARVAREYNMERIIGYIDDDIIFTPAWQYPETAWHFMRMFTLPYDFLDLLRPTITGEAEIEFGNAQAEAKTAEIIEHLLYGLRAFYLWLAEERIHRGTQLLEKLVYFTSPLSFPNRSNIKG